MGELPPHRTRAAAQKKDADELGWRINDGGHRAETPEGVLDFSEDTKDAISEATILAEERRVLCTDKRLHSLWGDGDPMVQAHRRLYQEADAGKGRRRRQRAAAGRTWEHKSIYQWLGPVPGPCRCGDE